MAQRAEDFHGPRLVDSDKQWLAAARATFPQLLTSLVGRQQEIQDVAARVTETGARLITLTGPGGIGKTRLALGVAQQFRVCFTGGVWFVPLASISDPDLVIPTIARSMHIAEQANRPVLDTLIDQLQDRRMLLVLDNFEHVIEAATDISRLLGACPAICVLVTSREPLRLSGEQEYLVQPLAFAVDPHESATSGVRGDAVRLFVERAKQVVPDFSLTDENTRVIVEICRRLDGVPLALELAAARLKVFSPDDLLSRLDHQPLKVLTGGPRDVPARQQTMRATLQWSYDLLSRGEQQLFRRLSVFAGGCTLPAVEAIVSDDHTLEALASLVDKGLVRRVDPPERESRYVMLEPVRQFASEIMTASGDEAVCVRDQHARYFLSLVRDLNDRLNGPEVLSWFRRTEAEQDNLRVALHWLRESRQVELGLEIIGELGMFWSLSGYVREGQSRALEFLEMSNGTKQSIVRARALWPAGYLWIQSSEFDTALRMMEEAISIAAKHGDRVTLGRALFGQALCHAELGNVEQAQSGWERALPIFREVGDESRFARTHIFLGNLACRQGDLDRARTLLDKAVALARAGDLKWIAAVAPRVLGRIEEQSGDYRLALDHYCQYLTRHHELGFATEIPEAFEVIARIAHRSQEPRRAVRLLGAASMLRERTGSTWYDVTDLPSADEVLSALRSTMPDADFENAWKRGRGMSLEDAIAFAVQRVDALESELHPRPPDGLTPREVEVLGLIAAGRSNRQMADDLYLSVRTVERHVANIYRKIDAHNRSEATSYAIQRGLVDVTTT